MSPATLDVKVTTDANDATVVALCGDGSIPNADLLARALLPLTASRPSVVLFDCTDLRFISSLLIGHLVEFQRGLARHGGKVRLLAPQPSVLKVLQHSRLDTLFEIVAAVH